MYIIAGLGNPGKEYENTRHNIGFDVIDRLAEEENIAVMESKHKALIGKGYVADDTAELIVISDDISLDVGQIRIRKKGSAGGHNGLKNIIKMLGHDTFIRVRMGVGEKPKNFDLADYVLGHFPAEERNIMDEAAKTAAEAIRMIITENADAAMNHFNSKKA